MLNGTIMEHLKENYNSFGCFEKYGTLKEHILVPFLRVALNKQHCTEHYGTQEENKTS